MMREGAKSPDALFLEMLERGGNWRLCDVRIRRVIDIIKYLTYYNYISLVAGQNKQRQGGYSKKTKVLRCTMSCV